MAEEHELKLPVEDLKLVRLKLKEVGAELLVPRSRELNVLFDRSGELAGRGSLLRLRQYRGRQVLTFKGPASFSGGVKSRTELEVDVSNGAQMAAILAELGFKPALKYEKYRELWALGGCQVALDWTAVGMFVEVEGNRSSVAEVAGILELDVSKAVKESYVALWLARVKEDPSIGRPDHMPLPEL